MLLALALFAAMSPDAHAPFPKRARHCQWVRGRFAVANGSSINRLYVSKTKHALALYDGDERVPPAIRRYWNDQPLKHSLWGDFYVCARERYIPGHMQHVRILGTRRTVIAGY